MIIDIAISRAHLEVVRWGERLYVFEHLDPDRYPLLFGVDPEGNTLFNVRQIPLLRKEILRLLADPECGEEMRISLLRIQDLIDSEYIRPHQFLRFVGE